MMRARGWYVHVSMMNYSRVPDGFDTRSPGREWVLQVSLFRDTDGDTTAMDRGERLEPILLPAEELPSRAEAGRALLTWGLCEVEGCPQPRRETMLTALRCRPDAIFRGDPVKVICHLAGYYRLERGGRDPLMSDCFYFWRGLTSGGPWAVLAVPDAEFCEE